LDILTPQFKFFQFVRNAFLVGLIYAVKTAAVVDSTFLAILIGCVLHSIVLTAFSSVMLIFGYEELNWGDTLFLMDDDSSRSNVQGCFFFDKFEYEDMRSYILSKTSVMHRMRSKIVEIFGQCWFVDMSPEEWK